jgi:hypothetical protein
MMDAVQHTGDELAVTPRQTVFEQAAAALGEDVVERLRQQARDMGPLTPEQVKSVGALLAMPIAKPPPATPSAL